MNCYYKLNISHKSMCVNIIPGRTPPPQAAAYAVIRCEKSGSRFRLSRLGFYHFRVTQTIDKSL